MSALSIQVPFPVFQDRDGQPLENGYVWIGQPNLNPQTNPVVTYYDAALTIVAPQPLRTLNGYVSSAGTPAKIYVDGVNFSILVQDSKGSMVYNFPDGTGISPNAAGVSFTGFNGQVGNVQDLADDDGSDWIGFLQSGTGADARSAQNKMREVVSVMDFGAVGDGVADDTSAINDAIASVTALGGDVLFPVPSVSYLVSSTLSLPQGVRLIGQGANLRWRNTKTPVKIEYTGGVACISVVAAAGVVVDAGQIFNIQLDGTNALANTDGLLLDASAASSAIEGFYCYELAVTNFPRYQVHHTGDVFDITYDRLSALNPDRAADTCVFIQGVTPSQITFNDCWIAPYTAGKYAVYQAAGGQDLRFFGGTIAPYSTPLSANGIYANGGLYIYGTHIEGIGPDLNSVGITYIGSTAAFIAPSQCSGFGTNLLIGDTVGSVARGWVVAGNIGGHNTGGRDVRITAGAARNGTIVTIGYANGLGVIQNERQTVDGVFNEVNNLYGPAVYANNGVVVQTPNGLANYRIAVDNAGAITTTLV